MPVVPLPMVKSKTVSPTLVIERTMSEIKGRGFSQGCFPFS
jgi:hypothetical protein